MRMIGIGLMGFLLAGVALLLSTMNILDQGKAYVRSLASEPQLVFEHRNPAEAQGKHSAVILRANPDHPVILSGLPAYQSVAFIMPVDARPTSGYLQIDATSQVLDGVEGVLRISIHNTRRGEMLLRSGEAGRSLQIPLSPTDFAGNQLVVSFSLQGTGPQHQCGPEDGVEAVVEIETTSAVYLTLDRALLTPRDRVHAWGNVARIAWPRWLKPDEQVRRLVLATALRQRGLETRFETIHPENALKTDDLRAALVGFPQHNALGRLDGTLARSGSNAGLRRFHRQTVWRERYKLSSAEPMPAQLDLRLQLGRLLGGQRWTLTVTLNNRLVFQAHVSGTDAGYAKLIDLPPAMQSAKNTLEVVATSNAPQNGVCDRGPELVAEMLPSSRLVLADGLFDHSLSQVHAALGTGAPVSIAATDELTALDADTAHRMLNEVVPLGAEMKPAGRTAHVIVLAPGFPAPDLRDAGPVWLVTYDPSTEDLTARRIGPEDVPEHTQVALLIALNAVVLPEAKG